MEKLRMKYRASIMLHPGILDNAGNAVKHALHSLGFPEVNDVRIGKILIFEARSLDEATKMAKSQTNEVMEFFEIEELKDEI